MRRIDPHPLANIFPLMEGESFDELVADVKTNGLHDTIILFEDKILDGRNRYLACIESEVVPRFQKFQGDYEAASRWVWSHNVHRRHLTPGQVAAALLEREELVASFRKKAKEALHRSPGRPRSSDEKGTAPGRQVSRPATAPNPGTVAKQLAETSGHSVGVRTVERVARVKQEDPALYQQVRDGKISAKVAEDKVRAKKQQARIKKVLAEAPAPPPRQAPDPAEIRKEEAGFRITTAKTGMMMARDGLRGVGVEDFPTSGFSVADFRSLAEDTRQAIEHLLHEMEQL